jgi:hypothetical protein
LAYEAVQQAESERIAHDWPDVGAGPDKLVISVDGAMVPLVHGEWAEVKTLVVGEVGPAYEHKGERVVPTHSLSYFSRLTDAETFQQLTLGELYQRRVETAGQVAAVCDGAEWIQGFMDYHCPEAIRILDFAHAAERVCQIGEAVLGADHASLAAWQTRQLHQLKQHGPDEILPSLRRFAAEHLTVAVVAENLAYLEKRVAQLQYPSFRAAEWPIGSGMVESANKLVVEARLKGAGMHWERASVNPLLALRTAVCNDRWEEAWRASAAQIGRVGLVRRVVQPKRSADAEASEAVPSAIAPATEPVTEPAVQPQPPATHPWRRTNYATKARMAEAKALART